MNHLITGEIALGAPGSEARMRQVLEREIKIIEIELMFTNRFADAEKWRAAFDRLARLREAFE